MNDGVITSRETFSLTVVSKGKKIHQKIK